MRGEKRWKGERGRKSRKQRRREVRPHPIHISGYATAYNLLVYTNFDNDDIVYSVFLSVCNCFEAVLAIELASYSVLLLKFV